jgi:hypothetical protein
MDVSTELVSSKRPALFRSLPFHLGSLATTLSTRACSSSRRRRPIFKGSPRYLVGRLAIRAWKLPNTVGTSMLSHRIRIISVFWMLAHSAVAHPNEWSSSARFATSHCSFDHHCHFRISWVQQSPSVLMLMYTSTEANPRSKRLLKDVCYNNSPLQNIFIVSADNISFVSSHRPILVIRYEKEVFLVSAVFSRYKK